MLAQLQDAMSYAKAAQEFLDQYREEMDSRNPNEERAASRSEGNRELGVQILPASSFQDRHFPSISVDRPALILGVHDEAIAQRIVTLLLKAFPGDHRMAWLQKPAETDREVDLAFQECSEILARGSRLSEAFQTWAGSPAIVVPAHPRPADWTAFAEVIAHLRAPEGCPWDREQSHQSLKPYLIEEAYETLDAIDAGDFDALCEELGDLLLQIGLHSQIAMEEGKFLPGEVIAVLVEKLIHRHPHVFGDVEAEGTDQVLANWESLKRAEKQAKAKENGETGDKPYNPLAGIPKSMPALSRTQLVLKKAARLDVEWVDISSASRAQSARQIKEAMGALEGDLSQEEAARRLGQALLAMVRIAASYEVDADSSLRTALSVLESEFERASETP